MCYDKVIKSKTAKEQKMLEYLSDYEIRQMMKKDIEDQENKKLFSIFIEDYKDENLVEAVDEISACLWLYLDAGYLPGDKNFPFDMGCYEVKELIRNKGI